MSNVTMSFSNFFTVVELYWLLTDVWDMARMYRTAWHHYLEVACTCRPYFDWGLMRATMLLFHQDDGRMVITNPQLLSFQALIQTQGTCTTRVQPLSWQDRLGHDFIQWNNIKIYNDLLFLVLYINTSCWCTWYCCRTSNGRNVLPTCETEDLALFNTSDKPWETEDVRKVFKIHLLHYWV